MTLGDWQRGFDGTREGSRQWGKQRCIWEQKLVRIIDKTLQWWPITWSGRCRGCGCAWRRTRWCRQSRSRRRFVSSPDHNSNDPMMIDLVRKHPSWLWCDATSWRSPLWPRARGEHRRRHRTLQQGGCRGPICLPGDVIVMFSPLPSR